MDYEEHEFEQMWRVNVKGGVRDIDMGTWRISFLGLLSERYNMLR
jgi:hypothetical protein